MTTISEEELNRHKLIRTDRALWIKVLEKYFGEFTKHEREDLLMTGPVYLDTIMTRWDRKWKENIK
jgi:hypothetical protein